MSGLPKNLLLPVAAAVTTNFAIVGMQCHYWSHAAVVEQPATMAASWTGPVGDEYENDVARAFGLRLRLMTNGR